MVVCELCKDKKPKTYDTGHNFSLSNLKLTLQEQAPDEEIGRVEERS
jgi:hypothetical protein